ncbi:MAG: efflux RND transporter periplasmic adaptor subunit [Candidatus Deferrimicrobiaceae bacterium]
MSEERKDGMSTVAGEENPAARKKTGRVRDVGWIALLLALLWAGTIAFYNVPAFHRLLHPHPAEGVGGGEIVSGKYTCPMHPFIVNDRPGACPICGMTLVPQESMASYGGSSPGGAAEKSARKILYWTDPMIPGDRSDRPGKSPMGMDRVPVYEEAAVGSVSVNSAQRVMANVATEKVAMREFSLDTIAVGKIAWDERKVAKVAARFGGRVEKLHVNFTGTRVDRGQPLLDIYSPELVATQREYLLAREGLVRMKESPYGDAREMSSGLLAAVRRRLALWNVTDAQIEELERTGEPRTAFTVFAPASGVVTERLVTAGQYVMEGTLLYAIADLGNVWILAEIYETEIHKVAVGTQASITTDAYPGREFRGRVAFVDPFLNPETRTVRVRVDLPNPGGLLKPEMFVNVSFRGKQGKALSVPDTAVLVTGRMAMAWVETAPNAFEPRVVRTGQKSGGYYEILSGLSEGDTVVTSGGFLLDSESQLKGGTAGSHAGHGAAGSPPDGKREQPSGPSPAAGPSVDPHAAHGAK